MAKKVKKVIPSQSRWIVEKVDDRSGKWHPIEGCPSDFTGAQAFAEGLKLGAGVDASFVRVVHTGVPALQICGEFIRRINSRFSDDPVTIEADADETAYEGGALIFTARVRISSAGVQEITADILTTRAEEEMNY